MNLMANKNCFVFVRPARGGIIRRTCGAQFTRTRSGRIKGTRQCGEERRRGVKTVTRKRWMKRGRLDRERSW